MITSSCTQHKILSLTLSKSNIRMFQPSTILLTSQSATLKVSYLHFQRTTIKLFFLDRYNIYNLAHHHLDFNLRAVWTYSASGHDKGPCDGLGAVVKSTATHYLLRAGPTASFSIVSEALDFSNSLVSVFHSTLRLVHSGYITGG